MNNLPGGGPQNALIQMLARNYGGQPSPNPPWATQRLSIDGINGTTRTIPGQETPYGAFHDPTDGDQGYGGPNVGAIAAGHLPFDPGGPMIPYTGLPVHPALQHHAASGMPGQLHPMVQAALDHVRRLSPNGDIFGPGPGHQLPLHLPRAQGIFGTHNIAQLLAGLTQRQLTRNRYGGRH